MRAFVVEALGRYAVRDDVEPLPLSRDGVRVQMKAAGICRTDLSVITGAWPIALPCVDGHEGAGVVLEVGADVVAPEVDQHVIIAAPNVRSVSLLRAWGPVVLRHQRPRKCPATLPARRRHAG